MKRGKGRDPTNPTPRIFHWSNGFSSTAVRCCGYPGGRMTSTSCAKNISLVQWFLIDHCSLLQLSRGPDDRHIKCQKYFTGPMVSHRPLFAVAAITEAGRQAHHVPKIFHWSNGFSTGGGPHFLRGYVGSVLEVEGLGCNSPCIARPEDPTHSSHSKLRWFRCYWGFGVSPTHQPACRLAPPDLGVEGRSFQIWQGCKLT
jgi:hypothetical protein